MSKYIVLHGISIAKDFTPETFGRLTSIGPAFRVRQPKGSTQWMIVCRCECGEYAACDNHKLIKGGIRSCGCLRKETMSKSRRSVRPGYFQVHGIMVAKENKTETYERLTSIGPAFRVHDSKGVRRVYRVYLCECGEFVVCQPRCAKSCGCLHKEKASKQGLANATHGNARRCGNSSEYDAWNHMKGRVFNTRNMAYKDYGGRGITMCNRWSDPSSGFVQFLEDMGKRPSPQHSIDRIDVNGNYEKDNCRWATQETQMNNTRRSKYITAFGRTQTISMWAKEIGIKYATLFYRINKGMNPEDAMIRDVRVLKSTRHHQIQNQ